MRVLVCPADEGGCGHYRLIWPAQVLKAVGLDVVVERESVISTLQIRGRGVVAAHLKEQGDVIVMQRPLQRVLVESIPLLQAQGVKVVVECDDDFGTIHRHNPAWYSSHPKADPDRNFQWLKEACHLADLVTVSTPRLQKVYGSHGRCVVVPNFVPERYLKIDRVGHDDLWLGWSGSVATHQGDLEVTRGAVWQAVQGAGAVVAVVGTGAGVRQALRIPDGPSVQLCGWVPIDTYAHALAEFDVGIVPLVDSAFNEAKSWLKGLEMAAVGVPFVASPTQQYRALVELGAGQLAHDRRQWLATTKALLRSKDLRDEQAGRGRDVASQLTIEAQAGLWWDAWCSARSTRH